MVSIIIVNYNLSKEIVSCLVSLERHLPNDSFNVIVVDNNSSDSEFESLIEHIKQRHFADIITLNKNIGFGRACNIGATRATGDFLCFLNPDTTVDNDFLHCLKTTLDSSGCTMVGPVYTKPSFLEFSSGYFPNIVWESLSVFLIGRHLEAALMSVRRNFSTSYLKVDWILGACLLLSKQNFDQLGGFDENFFLYFEEVDLCKRIYSDGGSVVVATNCRINHIGSLSGKRDYIAFTERFFTGKLRYVRKHTSGLNRIALTRIIWLQLQTQKVFWSLVGLVKPVKSKQKIEGLNRAISYFKAVV